jgi:hypothetical protein
VIVMRRNLVKLTPPLLSSLSSTRAPSSLSLLSITLASSLSLPPTPRSYHATPALNALIRSTALKRPKEDALSVAQADAKKGKLTSDKYEYDII